MTVHYRTDSEKVSDKLPYSLKDGHGVNVRVPVYEASERDMPGIDGIRAHTSGDPEFHVKVNLQRSDDDECTIWGLWNPDDDDEYLGHSVQATGVGHGHFDRHRAAVRIEEWLNEILADEPHVLEGYVVEKELPAGVME